MYKLKASVIKEFLVLIRDIPGLIILFIMPAAMIIVVTLVQDSTLKSLSDSKIKILYVDNDNDILSNSLKEGLLKSEIFDLDTSKVNYEQAKNEVAKGKYRMAIIIPEGAADTIRKNIKPVVENIFSAEQNQQTVNFKKLEIQILTDPTIKNTFKQTMISDLQKYTSKIETQILFKILAEQLEKMTGVKPDLLDKPIETITFKETFAFEKETSIKPNSTQHNVPAWTMFAMFFIVIPLAGNMIYERENGSFFRLLTMPGNYLTVLGSKTIVYLGITFLQFILMILAGIFVLPLFGLPVLNLGTHPFALLITALASGLAAVGYGILVGTIAETHEQAGVFGSVSVIILASLGGIWFPVYAMPAIMQKISVISPLNWGLESFYDIFLKNGTVSDILPEISALTSFFIFTILIAYFYEKAKRMKF
ncbi:MAG: ABC transporter permease [Bacteroidales bacterium]|nr:ABC transporter permease [Bacteroidales bacterium]